MQNHRWYAIVSALCLAGMVGCSTCGTHQPLFPQAPWNKNCCTGPTTRPGAAPVGMIPGQPMPLGTEASVTPPPGGTLAPAPGSQPLYQSPVTPIPSAPAPSAPEIRGYGPAADSTWHAPTANGGVQ